MVLGLILSPVGAPEEIPLESRLGSSPTGKRSRSGGLGR